MKIKIQFFGPLTEICNLNEFDLDGDPDTNKLLERLKEMYPAFNTAVFAVAVNNQLVQENLQLRENDIVSLLPPFSGG